MSGDYHRRWRDAHEAVESKRRNLADLRCEIGRQTERHFRLRAELAVEEYVMAVQELVEVERQERAAERGPNALVVKPMTRKEFERFDLPLKDVD